jgi:hypothetical protein
VEATNTKAITAKRSICANAKKAMPKATLLLSSQTQLTGAGTAHRRISWIDPQIASEPDSAGRRSVWDTGIANKSSLAHCGLLAGPIEIVHRQPQGFWLDITLGLGGLWARRRRARKFGQLIAKSACAANSHRLE